MAHGTAVPAAALIRSFPKKRSHHVDTIVFLLRWTVPQRRCHAQKLSPRARLPSSDSRSNAAAGNRLLQAAGKQDGYRLEDNLLGLSDSSYGVKLQERHILSAGARIHAGLSLNEMTRKVTICGGVGGQGAAMALIMHFLRGQHAQHPEFELDKIVFSGLNALAMIKNASRAAHPNSSNPSDLRESFWTLLTLPSREVPITIIYRGDDHDGDEIFRTLMESIETNCAQWATSSGVSTADARERGEVRLPFVVPKATSPQQPGGRAGRRGIYWETPWRYLYIGEVISNPTAKPAVQHAVTMYRHSAPMPTGTVPSPPPPAAAPPLLAEYITVQNLGLALFDAVKALSHWHNSTDDEISQHLLVILLARDLYTTYQYPRDHAHGLGGFALGAADLVDGWTDEDDPLDANGIDELAHCGHRLHVALLDGARKDRWARNFADKYTGTGHLHVPGGQSEAVHIQVANECRATLVWIQTQLLGGIAHVVHAHRVDSAQRTAHAHASH